MTAKGLGGPTTGVVDEIDRFEFAVRTVVTVDNWLLADVTLPALEIPEDDDDRYFCCWSSCPSSPWCTWAPTVDPIKTFCTD